MNRILLTLYILAILSIFRIEVAFGQLDDECKLSIGTNLGGLSDFGTELPFVDLMHNSREWYTKSVDDPDYIFDSGFAKELSYREDGYPTHIPQQVSESNYLQEVATIWAITDGWPSGVYTVLWDGTGQLDFWGTFDYLEQTDSQRIIFDIGNPVGGVIEMRIKESDINDPIRNIRVLMPGSEDNYEEEVFNPIWINKLKDFKSVRFMDWGQTNNWGNPNPGITEPLEYFSWDERSKLDHYTWAYNKGIPYEMMIRLMNELDIDGWVCVPHRAGEEYQKSMAQLFKDNLEPERHLYVEYSNEIWNWIFDQTHWVNEYGCEADGDLWPEGIVEFVQNTMNYWTEIYSDDLDKITRVVGVFTAWLDVSERIVYNLDPTSFDAISPTYYIGLNEDQDAVLDNLGENATAENIINYAYANIPEVLTWIDGIQAIADSLHKEMVFYEGGQHLTPHPFGEEPSYAQALIDVQRSPLMYELYLDWFEELKKYQKGDKPLLLMNFSFISDRSAQYGSWGILETMEQDTSLIPAPKYRAITEINNGCQMTSTIDTVKNWDELTLFPNPALNQFEIKNLPAESKITILDLQGRPMVHYTQLSQNAFDIHNLPQGLYMVYIYTSDKQYIGCLKLVK
ncbi:MAG: T9SS type A sorting domain-containing protein [Lewinellaceae bacterium]|nr:T9SS type A sorting domain-containing protein [Lewinellaceae bacterium]